MSHDYSEDELIQKARRRIKGEIMKYEQMSM